MYNPLKIKTIYLVLGHNCNFSCKYCIQNNDFKKDKIDRATVSEKVYSYIRELIENRPSISDKIRLIFWGGEPLLYFNLIKDVVNNLEDSLEYGIISNGALLTGEIVDFLNEHNIFFTVSNDGPNTKKTRRINVLENETFRKLFTKIKERAVSSVISAYNQDFQELNRYIEKMVGKTNVNYDLLAPSEALSVDAYNFDYEKLTDSLIIMANKAAEDLLLSEKTNESNFFVDYINRIKVADKNPKAFINRACEEMHSSVSIDIAGNILLCHNSSDVMGNVEYSPYDLELNHSKYLKETNIESVKQCKDCFIYNFCGGDCKLTQKKYTGIKESCELRRTVFAVTFYLVNKLNNYFETVDISEEDHDND